MTNEEKILEILFAMQGDVSSLKDDVSTLKGDVSTLKSDVSSLKDDVSTLKSDVLKINIKLETVIEPRIDALAEGHAAILEQLVPAPRVDALENDVSLLKTVVRHHSEELQQLKRAQ